MELSWPAAVRTAGPADVAAIAALVNQAYAVEAFFVRGPRIAEDDVRQHLDSGAFLLVGEPPVLAGCVYVELRGTTGYFGLLSVAPTLQGRGLGRRLVAAAEESLRAAGCREVQILVVNLREELLSFYGRLGYEEAGTEPFPEAERERLTSPCHFVVMRKPLP